MFYFERNKVMKKKILLLSLIAIFMSLVAYGTTAFFTYEGTATNVITTGNVDISLNEWTLSEESGKRIPSSNDSIAIHPGAVVSKIAEVQNTGDNDAWVRISVEKIITLADGIDAEPNVSLIELDLNTSSWIEKDGYYYYCEKLHPGEVTEPIFTCVTFSASMNNDYQNSSVSVKVTAYATQTANNGNAVFEANGWPESK